MVSPMVVIDPRRRKQPDEIHRDQLATVRQPGRDQRRQSEQPESSPAAARVTTGLWGRWCGAPTTRFASVSAGLATLTEGENVVGAKDRDASCTPPISSRNIMGQKKAETDRRKAARHTRHTLTWRER